MPPRLPWPPCAPWQALPGWPSACHVCGGWPTQPLCAACVARFARSRERCLTCAAPLSDAQPCPACRLRPPDALDACLVAVDYGYPWDGLIARFKFRGESAWAGPFAELMLRAPGARELARGCDFLLAIPLGARRLAERGHHPPWALARALGRRCGTPCRHDLLERVREGPSQRGLGRAERLRNLAGGFAVPAAPGDALAGARVVLVDDVTTTGATLQAAAQALRAAGAASVGALVFARTPAPGEPPG